MYSIAQPQPNQPYVRMMQNPIGKQYRPYQGVPQVPFEGQHIQTQPFHPFQGQEDYVYPPYYASQVPLYQDPPYSAMQVPISHDIPSYRGYRPLDFNHNYLSWTLEFPYFT